MEKQDPRNRMTVFDMVSKFEGGRSRTDEDQQKLAKPRALMPPGARLEAPRPANPEHWPQREQDRETPQRKHGEDSRGPRHSPLPARKDCEPPGSKEPPGASRDFTWKRMHSFRKRHSTQRLIRREVKSTLEGPEDEEEETVKEEKKVKETVEEKLFKIAKELLDTEKAYVSRLHLLDQVFYAELLKEARSGSSFPEDIVKQIFSNISSVFQFHQQFFLPELQRRMDDWGSNPRIGDILQKVAPFLKMYGQYVCCFDRAMDLITTWMEKSPRFEEIVLDIQKREACGNLTLQHHMLEPVQRVPRYEMLLKDYLKKLPPGSPDRADSEKALEIIFEAAKHSNAAIADMERLEKLWEVYEMLGMEEEMVDPSNKLIKEGPILKISFRSASRKERHIFLFNNMLLYCVPKFSLVGVRFFIRTRLDMDDMQVKDLNDVEFPHAFLVSGKLRTLELQARSQEEMQSWIQACQQAIDQNEKKTESFKAATSNLAQDLQQVTVARQELGKRAPQLIRDKLVSMCMRCKEPFNAFIRRRHHCRACGYVVCWKCSDYKAALEYDENRQNRVCFECSSILEGQTGSRDREDKKRGILEKEAAEVSGRSLMCSFLQVLEKNGRVGSRGWFVIPRDEPMILYMYAAPQDVKAQSTIPLLGYQVKELLPGDNRCAFQLTQSKQTLSFLAESEEQRERWAEIINQVANGENQWSLDV
ncbi:FYVE, RhoGEF and PH domain-containing protein 2-like isoform X1 [Acipenser ruthenus]|uniref:FYVE, RhoGEF and PH domain-containing protein 2-like isoform X1 n=1 Tax=Acipenser ruthenus TaxID=7906 RepID=UPI0027426281|nr:FYVE, RhoGEF and PH domain-containing protein 2-like isoform X1 [Acipenser ruthenus]